MADEMLEKEKEILTSFFNAIGHFSFDKAKEIVDKERDGSSKQGQSSTLFISILPTLSQFALVEKLYAALQYLGHKGFLRKDSSVKSMYESIRNEFRRLEERNSASSSLSSRSSTPIISSFTPSLISPSPSPSPSSSSITNISLISTTTSVSSLNSQVPASPSISSSCPDASDKFISHICQQLSTFSHARLEMLEFYEKLYAQSSSKFIKYEEFITSLLEIIHHNQKLFHHPILAAIKSSFNHECDCLLHLLEAQVEMQKCHFLPSLLRLNECHSKLMAWGAVATNPKDGRKLSSYTGILRPPPLSNLYNWLNSFKAASVSKFSLYFHDVLSKQTTHNEMKNLCSKTTIDCYQKFVTFQKKTDATCIALVLDTLSLDDYWGPGYVLPNRICEPIKGVDSYPTVVCYPNERPKSHWPNVISIMNDKAKQLTQSDQPVYFYDTQVQTTYYLIKVDAHITLVAIFASKKSERDSYIVSFFQEISLQLRGNKFIANLKPGGK